MAQTIPTTPGVYRDRRGDLWTLGGNIWRHIAKRTFVGEMWQVRDHPGISAKLMAEGDWDDDVLPFEAVEVGDVPPEIVLP